jgi:hypothetical protein
MQEKLPLNQDFSGKHITLTKKQMELNRLIQQAQQNNGFNKKIIKNISLKGL